MKLAPMNGWTRKKSLGARGYFHLIRHTEDGHPVYYREPIIKESDYLLAGGVPAAINVAQALIFPKSDPVWGLVASGALAAFAAGFGNWPAGMLGAAQSILLYWARTEQGNKVSF